MIPKFVAIYETWFDHCVKSSCKLLNVTCSTSRPCNRISGLYKRAAQHAATFMKYLTRTHATRNRFASCSWSSSMNRRGH